VIAPPATLAVIGPTGTGKSDLGVALACELGGEVVNADAFQLYRGMDIGTAKLDVAARRGVPHHLLDVLDVREEASLARYAESARAAITDISARGRVPILVGGSALYLRAVLDRLQIPPTDPALRARLEDDAAELGDAAMHARLAALDPAAAAAILPRNRRRVVRALEVIELTGGPFLATLPEPRYAAPAVQLGLRISRPVLDRRLADRVELMWSQGLVEETRALLAAGLRSGRTAPRALGYAQVIRYLDGELDDATARDDTVRATRRFARRQESWFRRDPRIHWLPFDDARLVEEAAAAYRAACGVP
jgi:tRNA dimethylallyltransferase